MKVRYGFVSNSSSSSFMAVVTEDAEVLHQIHDIFNLSEDDAWNSLWNDRGGRVKELDHGQWSIQGSSVVIFECNEPMIAMVGYPVDDETLRHTTVYEIEQAFKQELMGLGVKLPKNFKAVLRGGEWSNGA